jgi:protoheme IX farnesyltransferase
MSAPELAVPMSVATPRAAFSDYVALGKPRVSFMVFITALGGMWLSPMPLTFEHTLVSLFGITLVIYGANALNMYLERDVDALMKRTESRPLPAGRMTPDQVLFAGLVTSAAAVILLTIAVNPLTGLLSAVSLVLYVLVYTPWKRRSTLALLIGAIPGAAPPLLGWTAATGRIDPAGLSLFFILFIWQIPHFLAISIFRRDDYIRAGLKIMPGVRGIAATKQRIVLYAALLGVATLPAYATGLSSRYYLIVAVPLSLGFLLLALSGLGTPRGNTVEEREANDSRWARRVFFATIFHLPIVLGALALCRP